MVWFYRSNHIFRGTEQVKDPGYLTDVLARESCDFIRRHRDRPFLLYTAFNAVHTPLEATQEDLAAVSRLDFSAFQNQEKAKTRAAMLLALDRAVGQIMETLKTEGLDENTFVIFTNDNGDYIGNGPFSGGKGQVSEGGIRVPYLLRWKGRIRIEVDSSQGGFSLQIKKTNPQNYVRNIHVIMPGFGETWQQNPFHPAFLKRWQGMACFRFMDWMHTNGSEIATWNDRPILEHATFSKRGVALEWMIELCNRTQIDPWFCMPHQADDEFIRRFATMVKERLDPSLRIYIEYSNEVWNGQFKQSRYAGEQGVRLGLGPKEKPWEAGWHFTALRSMQIFQVWEDVFGGHDRFIRVLPTQSGNTGVSEGILSFRDAAKHADALAGAPYMPFSIGRGKTKDLGEQMRDWDVDQLLDYFEETAFQDSLGRMDKDKAVADKYGLKLIAYEGGQHMVAFVKDRELVAQSDEHHAAG